MDAPAEEALPVSDTTIRLSLSDLFVWMTLTAVLCFVEQISFYQYFCQPLEEAVNRTSVLLFFPVGIASLYLFVKWWWRKQPFDFQPGHWLLAQCGVVGIYYVVEVLIVFLTNPPFTEAYIAQHLSWVMLVVFLGQWGSVLSTLWAAWYFPVRSQWWFYLVLPVMGRAIYFWDYVLYFMGNYSLSLGQNNSVLLNIFLTLLELPVVVGLTIWDARTASRRDWLHWIGVGLVLLSLLFNVAQYGLQLR